MDAGGRGGAWFITAAPYNMVLRHYLRGGLAARFSRRSYVFTGFDSTRSLAEFRLLLSLAKQGLPVPRVIAACACKQRWLWYRAAILVETIEGARPLPEVAHLDDENLWRKVGGMIRRFHDAGLDHVDLNCDNILVASGQPHLIDFDRCRIRTGSSPSARWKQRNLDRLYRSVQKRCQVLPSENRELLWEQLVASYRGLA